jgi:hypothetical protein
MSKEKALRLLDQSIRTGSRFSDSTPERVHRKWFRDVRIRARAIFGEPSPQYEEVVDMLIDVESYHKDHWPRLIGERAMPLLVSLADEVRDLWPEVLPTVAERGLGTQDVDTADGEAFPESEPGKRVFVVHGHDHGLLNTVARFLEHLDLEPVILHEQASEGATIIEMLERHGRVDYAIVLLTPDDVGSAVGSQDNLEPRARQNVILELGFFLGVAGRSRVCALYVDGVELPSDYSGVLYVPVDKAGAWKTGLATELKAAGLPVDISGLV